MSGSLKGICVNEIGVVLWELAEKVRFEKIQIKTNGNQALYFSLTMSLRDITFKFDFIVWILDVG